MLRTSFSILISRMGFEAFLAATAFEFSLAWTILARFNQTAESYHLYGDGWIDVLFEAV